VGIDTTCSQFKSHTQRRKCVTQPRSPRGTLPVGLGDIDPPLPTPQRAFLHSPLEPSFCVHGLDLGRSFKSALSIREFPPTELSHRAPPRIKAFASLLIHHNVWSLWRLIRCLIRHLRRAVGELSFFTRLHVSRGPGTHHHRSGTSSQRSPIAKPI
jgi:hypothetical protein